MREGWLHEKWKKVTGMENSMPKGPGLARVERMAHGQKPSVAGIVWVKGQRAWAVI